MIDRIADYGAHHPALIILLYIVLIYLVIGILKLISGRLS